MTDARSPMRYKAFLCSAMLFCSLKSPMALAQSGDEIRCTLDSLDECITPEQVELLLPLLREARIAADEGRWQDALDSLRRADTIVPLGITRATMARALYELGELQTARDLSQTLLNDPDADARAMAEELLVRIEESEQTLSDEMSSLPAPATPQPEFTQESVAVEQTVTTPVVEDRPDEAPRLRRFRVTLGGLGAAAATTLSFGIVAGLRSERLERDAAAYDLTAPDASRAEQDEIGRAAANSGRLANVMFVSSALLGGTTLGLLLGDRSHRVSASLAWTGSGPGIVVGSALRRVSPR